MFQNCSEFLSFQPGLIVEESFQLKKLANNKRKSWVVDEMKQGFFILFLLKFLAILLKESQLELQVLGAIYPWKHFTDLFLSGLTKNLNTTNNAKLIKQR